MCKYIDVNVVIRREYIWRDNKKFFSVVVFGELVLKGDKKRFLYFNLIFNYYVIFYYKIYYFYY